MTKVLYGNNTDTWRIDSSYDQWLLDSDGSIAVDGIDIYEDAAESGNKLFIEGDLHAQTQTVGSTAIVADGTDTKVVIDRTSLIDTETGLHFNGPSQWLNNAGLIHVTGTAVLTDDGSPVLTVHNKGEITGTDAMVLTNGSEIFNAAHGLISGTHTAITTSGEGGTPNRITNNGTISGPVAIQSGEDNIILLNFGRITGSMLLGGGGDYLLLYKGTVLKGELDAGDGDDRIAVYQGAHVNKPIFGGTGNDSYFLYGEQSTLIHERKDEGNDYVLARMHEYTLPPNVEFLALEGNGDSHGVGNKLDNYILGQDSFHDLLEGRGGDDVLWVQFGRADTMVGGAGRDTFVFDHHRGVVQDFVEGKDRILFAPRSGIHSFDDLNIVQRGDDTRLGFSEDGDFHAIARLKDFDASHLSRGDFTFGWHHLYHDF